MRSPNRQPVPPRSRRLWRFWRADPAADADEEIRFHLESEIAELVAAGISPEDARVAALERFGDLQDITHTLHRLGHQRERTVRLTERLERVRQDARFALRQFARHPVFTAAAVLTMALGIGANSAIFSVAYTVLLKPLPYAHSDRLLNLRERNGSGSMFVTFGNYGVWRREATDFQALAGIWYGAFTLNGAGNPQRVAAYRVTADYWKALAIPPAAGRYFTAAEDQPGAPNVVVVSHAFWRTTLGGDSSIVGHAITLDGEPYTVVGVASPHYALNTVAPSIWVPLRITETQLQQHSDHELQVVGLVRPGIDTSTAIAQLTHIEQRLAADYPHSYFDGGIVATPLQSTLTAPARPLVLMLSGAVALVLLIACVNVANLLLARGASRRKEVAIRGALGAGRRRVVGQLLVESLLLSVAGGVLGIGLAIPVLRYLSHAAPANVPRIQDAAINLPVLLFTLVLAIVCGLVFGLAPALRTSRMDLQEALRDGHRGSGGSVRDRLRTGLVVAEIAVALLLLDGAGLLIRSAMDLQHVNPGFVTHNVLIAGISLTPAAYPSDTGAMQTMARIREAAAAIPGVQAAALVNRPPIAGFGMDCQLWPDGPADPAHSPDANIRVATGNFFAALGIPLLHGRTFGPGDLADGLPVGMINASLARHLFGNANPIGRRVSECADPQQGKPNWVTVVGVTGDIHAGGLLDDVRDELYLPLSQAPQRAMALVMHTVVPVAGVVPAVRRAVAAIDPTLPLSPSTMGEAIARSTASSRFSTTLFTLLGITGLILAAVGIYGVIAYLVVQRTHELGVRMALGAGRGRVLVLVVRHGLMLGLAGVAIGSVAALEATQVVRAQLYGISARDPVTFTAAAALLVLVTVAASFIPARRATRVDPLTALRGG